jgi:small-conductance mechanosensitive channel
VSREELAADYLTRMRHGLEVYRESFQPRRVVIGFVLAVAVLVLSLLLLSVVNRAGRDLATRVDRRLAARDAAAATDGLAHVRFRWLRDVARVGLAATRLALQIAVLLLCVQAVLRLIPWTEGYGNELLAATVATVRSLALGAVGELPNLLILLLFFFGTRYLLRSASALFDQLGDGRLEIPGFAPEWARPTDRVVTLLVLAFAVAAAWPYIPASDTPAFKGISIFLGALVSLGSGGAVANALAGTVLMYLRSFRVGDLVKSGETLGVVIEKGFFMTRLRTLKNVVVAIPNGQILGGQMLNYTEAGIREPFLATTCVTIGYDAPWRQVHALLERAAARTEGLSRERAPFVLQTALEDFYVRYELNVVLEDPRQLPAVLDRLHANIQDSFNEYGVQIMSPNYRGDRTVPTLVPPDQWYRPPARRPDEGDGGTQPG